MVQETIATNKTKVRTRPKPVNLWTVSDVQKWYKRHLSDKHLEEYAKLFLEHEITGRSFLRLNDDSLYRMGIQNNEHRDAILREILKQKLKTDIMEIRDLELKYNIYS